MEGRPDVVVDLSAPGALEGLKDKPFIIKEGATFRIKVVFQVHHEVLSGLKYLQVVKRKGIRVSKDEEMLGSYAPNTTGKEMYEKKCELPCLFRWWGDLLIVTSQRRGGSRGHDGSRPLQCGFQIHRR